MRKILGKACKVTRELRSDYVAVDTRSGVILECCVIFLTAVGNETLVQPYWWYDVEATAAIDVCSDISPPEHLP